MFRTVLALVLVPLVGASRVQVRDVDEAKFGSSCDDLHATFRHRVDGFQDFLDENPDLDGISRTAQARVMVRTYGIIRTLRRARTCSWVIENDSEEIEQARSIVQTLLDGNPCTEAARSELEAGASAETGELEIHSIQRTMAILSSDNCEPPEMPEQTENVENIDVDAQLSSAEDDLQDVIEELEDPVAQEVEAAFIQTNSHAGFLRGFMRAIGVAFLMLFMLLACAGAMAIISAFLVGAISIQMGYSATTGPNGQGALRFLFHGFMGGLFGGAVGLAGCAYQMYTQLLPRLTQ